MRYAAAPDLSVTSSGASGAAVPAAARPRAGRGEGRTAQTAHRCRSFCPCCCTRGSGCCWSLTPSAAPSTPPSAWSCAITHAAGSICASFAAPSLGGGPRPVAPPCFDSPRTTASRTCAASSTTAALAPHSGTATGEGAAEAASRRKKRNCRVRGVRTAALYAADGGVSGRSARMISFRRPA